ncbi:hypothetical protein K1719_041190 [Acacia pycnantha]|nr:hypothetical protein K1719_041190 [Acacia pycnantha]
MEDRTRSASGKIESVYSISSVSSLFFYPGSPDGVLVFFLPQKRSSAVVRTDSSAVRKGKKKKRSSKRLESRELESLNDLISHWNSSIMASKKKQSEGIALLSMYNDEEDDEMEDELAMSPEPEDGGLDDHGRVITGEEPQTTNGDFLDGASSGSVQVLTPSSQVNTSVF